MSFCEISSENGSVFSDGSRKGYVAAAGRIERRELNVTKFWFGEAKVERKGWEVTLTPPTKVMKSLEERTVTYSTVLKSSGRVAVASIVEIEECLAPLKALIAYKNRGVKFGTVECRFHSTKEALNNAIKKMENDKWMLLPGYLGKKVVKVTLSNIPPGVKPAWLVESSLAGEDKNIEILAATKIQEADWRGQILELIVHATREVLKNLAEVIIIGERKLSIRVGDKRPRYFLVAFYDIDKEVFDVAYDVKERVSLKDLDLMFDMENDTFIAMLSGNNIRMLEERCWRKI